MALNSDFMLLEESLIGRLKEEGKKFQSSRLHQQSKFPKKLKILAAEAITAGVPIDVTAKLLFTTKSRVKKWLETINFPSLKKVSAKIIPTRSLKKVAQIRESTVANTFKNISIELPGGLVIRISIC